MSLAALFEVGDYAVYPGHGVGRVISVETKEIMGALTQFYSIEILEGGMRVLVPATNVESVGVRPLVSKKEAGDVLNHLRQKAEPRADTQTWNRRYRDYMEKIKTGSVHEIAEVLKDLLLLSTNKELSFGERKMLDTARNLLITELAIATEVDANNLNDQVYDIFGYTDPHTWS